MAENKEGKKEIQMKRKCAECGKLIPDSTESPYCENCDEMLDKKFDTIEDNIFIFKELRDNEIETLKKFDKGDIVELYLEVYSNFTKDGKLSENEVTVLKILQKEFELTEGDVGKERISAVEEGAKNIIPKKPVCPECGKDMKEEFSFCPYCGHKL